MKRKLLAILTAVCMTATFVGGSATIWAAQEESAAKDEVIVTMPTTSEPEAGFDPAYGWGAGEHVHEPLIQSTLTVTNTDLSIGMDLATDYSVSEDGLTWTVKIRDDVKFTDGEPLTAEDVAFTYNNCRDNSSVNDFSMLKEAVAVDDTTIEFHMNTPFAVWPYTMAIVGIVPEHAYDENYGQNPIGSGRYIMKQWDKGQQVIFEANPDYYGEAPTHGTTYTGQRNSFLFSMLVMASYIIRADGRIMHSEMEFVRRFLRSTFGEAAVGEGERILLNLFEQRKQMDRQNPLAFKNTIRDCGTQIAANLTYEERLQLLVFLVEIAKSDGHVCNEEIEALKEVAMYMGLSVKEVESMLNLGGSSLNEAYKVLEVEPTATNDEVRAAYRRLALKHHPDRVATLGEDIKKAAEEKFQSINNAKEQIYKARGMK